MKLSDFIRANLEAILVEWEEFAATLGPLEYANRAALRDHAAAVLKVIALDLDTTQLEQESIDKSKGLAPHSIGDTAAETHAADRVAAGFSGEQVMAEFRALRLNVLRLWASTTPITSASEIQDMVRFNEAIDQAQSESMGRYASMLREAQTLFLSILGRDVRTPLGAISMGAQVQLRDPGSSAQAVKVGHRIFNSSQRMADIVRDLVDFSTTHLGEGFPIEPIAVDLGKLCEDVVEEVRMFHPERTITLQVAGEVDGNYDAARMAQVFSNLLANAVQHGHRDSSIRVGLAGDPEAVHFTVQNDAELIAPEKMRTFFDPVRRFAIRPSTERVGAGAAHLGLGLYVVKEIVRAHGGTVTVTSTAAEGVTFSVRLPRAESPSGDR